MTGRRATFALVLATAVVGGGAGVAAALPDSAVATVGAQACAEEGTEAGSGNQGLGRGGAAQGQGTHGGDSPSARGEGNGAGKGLGAGNGAGKGLGASNGSRRGSGFGPASGAGEGSGHGRGQRGRDAGGRGNGGPSGEAGDVPAAAPGATISDEVAKELAYLVEEEKLAGDIYELADSLYGMRVFDNISRSEDNHQAEVRTLLDHYDVDDPSAGAGAGEFKDADLQDLYDKLAAQVRESRDQAVAAGVAIEKADIADLEALISAGGLPSDVSSVAGNLLAGSTRHLAAFERQS